MPRPSEPGPKPDKLPIDRMPTERLVDVLPEGSPIGDAVNPPPPPPLPPGQTGVVSATQAAIGAEPWLFDETHMVLMGDLTAGANSSVLQNVLPLNDDLYVLGYSWSPTLGATQLITVWDPVTNVTTSLVPANTAGFATDGVLLGDDIYFWLNSSGSNSLAKIEGSDNSISTVTLPVNGHVTGVDGHSGGLAVKISDSNVGADLVWYDPNNVFDPFDVYTLSNNWVVSNLLGGSGNFYYFQGGASDASTYSIFRIDLTTEQVTEVRSNVLLLQSDSDNNDGRSVDGVNELAGALYFAGLEGDNYYIYRIDQSGFVQPLMVSTGWINALEETETSLWYSSIGDHLTKITADGMVIYNTSVTNIFSAQELNGVLYAVASSGSSLGLYRFDATVNDLVYLTDLTPNSAAQFSVVDTVNDNLIAYMDSNADGIYELWSSSTPEVQSSWVQISPSDVNVRYFDYGTVLNLDYLL